MLKLFSKKTRAIDHNKDFQLVCNALREIMPENMQQIKLDENTKIETLGIDSIKYINLLISLEEIIGKELEEIVDSIDLSSIKTVKDLVELVEKLQKNNP